jgi:hypothetical protein
LLEFEHESVVLKIIAGRASGGLRGPVTGLRTPLVDEGVLKKATGKEVRRNVHKLSSPAETRVWQEFGPEQPRKVKCQSEMKKETTPI